MSILATTLMVVLSADETGADPAKVKITMDGVVLAASVDVLAVHGTDNEPYAFSGTWDMTKPHALVVQFLNDAYVKAGQDRNAYLDGAALIDGAGHQIYAAPAATGNEMKSTGDSVHLTIPALIVPNSSSAPTAVAPPAPAKQPASAAGATVTKAGTPLYDDLGNAYELTAQKTITINGKLVASSSDVDELYWPGKPPMIQGTAGSTKFWTVPADGSAGVRVVAPGVAGLKTT